MPIIGVVTAVAVTLGIWAVVGELKRLRAEVSRLASALEQRRRE